MAPERILITGARGFVGSHLTHALRAAFPHATVIECAHQDGPGFSALDITDDRAVNDLVHTVEPNVCIHLAAVTAVPTARDDPARAWRVNLHGTLAIAGAIRAHAPDCTLIYASSSEVYGRSFAVGKPLDETAPLAPRNTYAATKAAADLALGALSEEGLRCLRFRLFNHSGAGQSPDFVLPAFARQIARIECGLQQPVMRVGALDPVRDFLDVRDVCAAYVACLHRLSDLPPGQVLNIASGVGRRIGDILNNMFEVAGINPVVEAAESRLRTADTPIAVGDAGEAWRLLGWRPVVPWEQTLNTVLDDWRGRMGTF